MKVNRRFTTVLLILLPVILLGLIAIQPRPLALITTWQAARVAAAQERYTEAADLYRQLIGFQPERTDLWDTVGGFEYKAEDYLAAVEAYQKVDQTGKISQDGMYNLGVAYQQIGDLQSAGETWARLARQPGLKPDLYSAIVSSLRQAGLLDRAMQAAEIWFKAYPDDIQAAYAYGLLVSYNDPTLAQQILLPVSLADSLEGQKSQTLLEGLEIAASHELREYSLVVVGQRLLKISEYDLAEQALAQAVDLNPEYTEAWAMLSEAQQMTGKGGWSALEKARDLNPNSEIVLVEMALYYRRQGEPGTALIFLEKLSAAHPEQASWQMEIGSALTENGDLIGAMSAYQRATELEPDNILTWHALAAFAAGNGFDAQSYSIPAAQKALELDSNNPQSLDLMGWILLIEGDLDNAEQFLQQALKQDATNPRVMLHLAQVYIEKNRLSLAFKPLSQAAAQTEDSSVALQASRLLDKYFPAQRGK